MSIQYKIYPNHVVVTGRTDHDRSMVIPNTYYDRPVTKIAPNAFVGDPDLQAVALPDIIDEIGTDAFRDCKRLKTIVPVTSYALKHAFPKDTVDFPCVLRSIGKRGFYGCESISHISFRGATFLGDYAFSQCKKLRSVLYENRVQPTAICDGAFANCLSLREVYLPWLYRISSYTFINCYNLREIVFSGNIREISDHAFALSSAPEKATPALTSLKLPEGVMELGSSAFEGQRSLYDVLLPESLCDIGDMSFKDCSSLDHVTLPKRLHSIGEQAFSGCRSLKSVKIPVQVTYIGQRFCEDSGVNEITVDKSNIHFYAQNGILYSNNGETVLCCSPQKKGAVSLLPKVREIAPYAFSKCAVSIDTFPQELQYVGENAFYASGIEQVQIPKGVRHVHDKRIFYVCSAKQTEI